MYRVKIVTVLEVETANEVRAIDALITGTVDMIRAEHGYQGDVQTVAYKLEGSARRLPVVNSFGGVA